MSLASFVQAVKVVAHGGYGPYAARRRNKCTLIFMCHKHTSNKIIPGDVWLQLVLSNDCDTFNQTSTPASQ